MTNAITNLPRDPKDRLLRIALPCLLGVFGCKSQTAATSTEPPPRPAMASAATTASVAASPSSAPNAQGGSATSVAPANAFLARRLLSDNCAVTAAGEAFCWGGLGKKIIRREQAFDGAVTVTGGRFYAYLLTQTGELRILGADPSNADNPRFDKPSPAPGWNDLEEVHGSAFAVCGREANGDVRCSSEQETPGYFLEGLEPSKLADLGGVVALDVGEAHACAVLRSGGVRCWGQGGAGELGHSIDGSERKTPVSVDGLSDAKGVCTGARFSCAMTRDAFVSCWGSNATHALGPGRPDGGPRPERVAGAIGVAQLSCTVDCVYAVTTAGAILTWGSPDKSKSDAGTVRAIPGPASIVEIQAANDRYCARQAGGSVWCWGEAHVGWAGPSATDPSQRPIALTK